MSRAAPPPHQSRSVLAGFLSLLGEFLITVGLVLGLFVAYSLWWTNVLADRQASARGDDVHAAVAERPGGERARGAGGAGHHGRHRLPARRRR